MVGRSSTRGKVVLVPFPFDDLTESKVRPAVCLTEPVGALRHVVLAFVTSQVEARPLSSDLVLDPHDPDFAQTGLRLASTVRLHRLLTVPTHFIRREMGQLSAAHVAAVESRLRRLFALN